MLAQTRLQARTTGMKSVWPVKTRTSGSSLQASSFGGQSKKLAHGRIARRVGVNAGETVTATAEMSASSFNVPPAVFPPPLLKLDGAQLRDVLCYSFNMLSIHHK
jgi:hypothetical protein